MYLVHTCNLCTLVHTSDMMPCCSSSFHFLTEQAYKMFLRLGCILIVVVLSHFSQTKSKGLSNERITTLSEKKSRQSAKNMFEQRKNRQNKHDKKNKRIYSKTRKVKIEYTIVGP